MATPRIWLTDAGAAAFRDGSNVETEAITFTKLAYGTGIGPQAHADARARAALRTQRGTVPLVGRDSSGGRFLLRGDVPAANPGYAITELGVLARIGTDPEFLALYGAVPDAVGDDVFGHVTPSTELVVPLSIDIVGMDAEFSAAVNATIQVADVPQATEAVVGKSRFATEAEAKAGQLDNVGVSPLRLAAVLSLITVMHITEDTMLKWNLPFSRALVVMKGGSSGGGGGGGGGAAYMSVRQDPVGARIQPIRDGVDKARLGGAGGDATAASGDAAARRVFDDWGNTYRYLTNGSGGGGEGAASARGGETSVTAKGKTYRAAGGRSALGGGGGGGAPSAGGHYAGGDGGAAVGGGAHPTGNNAGTNLDATSGAQNGVSRGGAPGGAAGVEDSTEADNARRNPGAGGSGEPPVEGAVVTQILSGLSPDDTLNIVIGQGTPGGAPGRGGGPGSSAGGGDGTAGVRGSNGWMRIIPLPAAA